MKFKNISIEDLAIYVSDFLYKHGVDTVLSGGACVTIYTNNKYMSYDLDFVLVSTKKQREIKSILEEIGFYAEGKHFKHKDTDFFLELIPPPLSVGEEPVKEISVIRKENRTLKLLSPTDCVKDRLAAYFHWDDRQSLEQAILVCKDNSVDFKELRRWSKNEGMTAKFNIFNKHLSRRLLQK